MKCVQFALFLVIAQISAINLAFPLEYAATCRGPTATITFIEGLDTARARAVAQYTLPDAVSHCHYELGRAQGKPNPNKAQLEWCAQDFMRDPMRKMPLTVEANCKIGTIGIPNLKSANTQKLPLDNSCAEGGPQAEHLFSVLCPSYEGQIHAKQ